MTSRKDDPSLYLYFVLNKFLFKPRMVIGAWTDGYPEGRPRVTGVLDVSMHLEDEWRGVKDVSN